ncbi:MAG: monovalent cation/H(+) antiporter subunit G [Polyangiaceae bacterium]
MRDGITVVLMALGVLLTFIGALGVVRLPDVYMRLSASAKASTLGVGSLLGRRPCTSGSCRSRAGQRR